jgi:hypothetical protein
VTVLDRTPPSPFSQPLRARVPVRRRAANCIKIRTFGFRVNRGSQEQQSDMNKKETYRLRLAAPVQCLRAAALLCSDRPSAGGWRQRYRARGRLVRGRRSYAHEPYISLIASCSRTRPRVRGDGSAQ